MYVGNLSWNVDREQLRSHMAEVGVRVYGSRGGVVRKARAVVVSACILRQDERHRMHHDLLGPSNNNIDRRAR